MLKYYAGHIFIQTQNSSSYALLLRCFLEFFAKSQLDVEKMNSQPSQTDSYILTEFRNRVQEED